MSTLKAPLEALTSATDAATTLVAFTTTTRTEYPLGHTAELDRAAAKHLRRLERTARIALKSPDRARYAALAGPTWHVLLAPHIATERVYLARADSQHHYRPGTAEEAPNHAPGTLLAHWADATTAVHPFAHVVTDEQLALVMYYSTADCHLYIAPTTPRQGLAFTYSATMPRAMDVQP